MNSRTLAILDINIPGGSGFELCAALRRESRVPILMLTVRGEEEDLVRALELGADDYLTKPFSPRTADRAREGAAAPRWRGGWQSRGRRQLRARHRPAHAAHRGRGGVPGWTPLESRLLQLLIANAGQVVATDRLPAAHLGSPRRR